MIILNSNLFLSTFLSNKMTNSSVEFTVDLSFNSFYNIASICNSNGQIHDGQKYWFSWNFNGKTYKSDEFTRHENGPPPLRHIEDFEMDCRPDGLLPRSIIQLFPLKVFFCTNQSILGITTFHPFKVDSVEEENIMSIVPFQISEWVEIKPIEDPASSSILYDPASMEISLKISIKSSITNVLTDDVYEDDQFDEEESAIEHDDAHVDKAIHFDVGLDAERIHYVSSNNDTNIQAATAVAVSTMVHQKQKQKQSGEERKKAFKTREDELEDDRKLRHYRLSIDLRSLGGLKRPAHVSLQYIYPYLGTSSPVRTSPKWMMAHSEAKIDGGAASFECVLSREQLRATLTSHPLKVTALTKSHLGNNILGELNIDLFSVMCTEPHSYRCPLTGKSFRSLREYSKHRQILLTLLAAGRVEQAPQKDPIVIKAIDSYLVLTHPSSTSSSSSIGSSRISKSDVKSGGSNYIVPLAEGAKLRVVLILEEIGVVGMESGVQVKPGYKMHSGALYDKDDDMYGGVVSSAVSVSVGLPPQASMSNVITNKNMNDVDGQAQIADDDADDDDDDDVEEDADDNGHERVGNMAGIYDHARIDGRLASSDPTMRSDLSPHERKHLEKLKLDWEAWGRTVDGEWREAMVEKETLLKKKLEADTSLKLVESAEDLKRAQIEAGKLEIRLRGSIEEVERQKAQLTLKEEQMQLRLSQKASELQLLQRRVRDEAKALVQAETRKNESLLQQLTSSQQSYLLMEKRAKDAEHDFDVYRAQLRSAPESVLREETARLKAQLGECRAEIERERRLRSESELEKEHFRSQMHRLALALKREREKSSSMARQELEELRLEFLAREER